MGRSPINIDTPTRVEIRKLSQRTSGYWERQSQAMALKLFHQAAVRVPAYKDFLKKHNVNPRKIKTIDDFRQLPWIDKENYLRQYPLEKLVWDGDVSQADIILRSSGSSGEPFYWPAGPSQVSEVTDFYDLVFKVMFKVHQRSTLVIIAYGMGSWVAGVMTLLSGLEIAHQTQPLTFATPGYNKKEVVEIATRVGPSFDQVVICAYPPLLKEIIDLGLSEGVNWPKLNLKYIFGAEAISEEFRDYMLKQAASKQPLLDAINTVGSADAMVLGHETPLTIAIKRATIKNAELDAALFEQSRTPTLAQYYPWQKYYNLVDEELLLTAKSGIPLIRYNIHDNVSLFSYDEIKSQLSNHGHDVNQLITGTDSEFDLNWKLPFIAVYGKSSNIVKLYGALIYPENIKAALELSHNARLFSGKFFIGIETNSKRNQTMYVDVELAPGIKKSRSTASKLKIDMIRTILEHNSEYGAVHGDLKAKAEPKIRLVEYGNKDFEFEIKHRYAKAKSK